jgi:hypothetical protein
MDSAHFRYIILLLSKSCNIYLRDLLNTFEHSSEYNIGIWSQKFIFIFFILIFYKILLED